MSKDLKVISLNKAKLRESIALNTYWKDGLSPFPKSKALWIITNNRIDENDYCCVITLEGDKIVSFIYMIPDFLNSNNKELSKVYWMISWWVHPDYKNTVLGTYTFQEALKLADNKVIIKSYAEHISDFYAKQPFTVITTRLRYTIFLSVDPSMLIGKFKFLKSFKFILDKFDYLVSSIINKINYNKIKKNIRNLKYDYINEIDNETWEFIEPLCANDLIKKSKDYVSWHIDNKQYTQRPILSKQLYTSLETGISNNISNYSLKIIKEKKIIGFISYIINFNEFNIRYFLVDKEDNYNTCIDVLIENFIAKKAKYIFTDDTTLSKNITDRFITVFTHKSEKKGLAHNSLKLKSEDVTLFNRDGHFY